MKDKFLVLGIDKEHLYVCDTLVEAIQKAEYAISQDHRLIGKVSIQKGFNAPETLKAMRDDVVNRINKAREEGVRWITH